MLHKDRNTASPILFLNILLTIIVRYFYVLPPYHLHRRVFVPHRYPQFFGSRPSSRIIHTYTHRYTCARARARAHTHTRTHRAQAHTCPYAMYPHEHVRKILRPVALHNVAHVRSNFKTSFSLRRKKGTNWRKGRPNCIISHLFIMDGTLSQYIILVIFSYSFLFLFTYFPYFRNNTRTIFVTYSSQINSVIKFSDVVCIGGARLILL